MVLFQLGVQRAAELEEEFVERQEGHGYAEENVGFDEIEHALDPDLTHNIFLKLTVCSTTFFSGPKGT